MKLSHWKTLDFGGILQVVLALLAIIGLIVGATAGSSHPKNGLDERPTHAPTSTSVVPTTASPAPKSTEPKAAEPAKTKLVPLLLTAGDGDSAGMPAKGSYRIPIDYSPTFERWRVGITMRPSRFDYSHGGDAVINQLAVGPHSGEGHFSSTPRLVASNLKIPNDGAAAFTEWQESPLGGGMPSLLSYTYTSNGGFKATPPGNLGGGWSVGNAAATDPSPSTTRVSQLPFDIWIEAEVKAETPVIAAIGDSITAGANADLPVHDSWANQYARNHGGLAVLYATSGDTGSSWVSHTDAYKVARFAHPRFAKPDAAIWAMGRNDFSGGASSAEMQEITRRAVEYLASEVSDQIYAATITPSDNLNDSQLKDYNQWLKTTGKFKDVFDFSTAMDDGSQSIRAEYNADGLHFNTAGYARLAQLVAIE
ncbi:SGNH/GDSL hydrolase family protein [Corynebacterium aurimucosum]|uniref:SGNH/GDSL hydrolase family protein n=1 Tax=Corynebacterium aurimucosum TaxID=169292 RepID=UPI003990D37F